MYICIAIGINHIKNNRGETDNANNMITTDNFTKVKHDVNGNPRYVLHFTNFDGSYQDALKMAKKLGGRKFHNKQYGGGIVFQSYNLQDTCNRLNELMKK